jgi:UDP:flavonoid glycosyltransferase YjiC (YdhE family)
MESFMKILMASTPATGHLNPLIAIATFLAEEGHEAAFLSATAYRARIEKSGAIFHALPGAADVDLNDIHAVAPELKTISQDWIGCASPSKGFSSIRFAISIKVCRRF